MFSVVSGDGANYQTIPGAIKVRSVARGPLPAYISSSMHAMGSYRHATTTAAATSSTGRYGYLRHSCRWIADKIRLGLAPQEAT